MENSAQRCRSGRSNDYVNQIHVSCTQREAVDHEAVQAKTDLCQGITTSDVMNEEQHQQKKSSPPIPASSYDFEGHVETWVDRHCELAENKASQHGSWRKRTAWMIINLHLMISSAQENLHLFVRRLYVTACTLQELVDRIYGGRSTCWHAQPQNGTQLVTTEWHN